MNNAKKTFNSLIEQCLPIMGLYDYVESNKIPIDTSDLLRWQYVLAVSALDKYIHDIVITGIIEEYHGRRTETKKYQSIKISLQTAKAMGTSIDPAIELSNEIIKQNSYLTFQDPDKISDALSYIWNEQHKWQKITSNMSTTLSAQDVVNKLKNIVIRRNQIAHQGDYVSNQVSLPRTSINKADTLDVIDFIKEIVNSIEKCI